MVLLLFIISFSKVSYLREHNSKLLKTGAANLDYISNVIEINTCNSLLLNFSHSTKKVFLCHNLNPACTHTQVAI